MDPNEGEVGIESIRLNGKKLDNLPPHQSRQAQLQLPEAIQAELDQKVENICGKFPRTTKEYVESRIEEARTSIKDFKQVKKDRMQTIKEFVHQAKALKGPSFRDIEPELEAIGNREDISFEERKALIREKRLACSQYDRNAMYEQVQQFQEDIERLDAAIQAENDSIADLTSTLGKLEIRDAELKSLGVTDIQ